MVIKNWTQREWRRGLETWWATATSFNCVTVTGKCWFCLQNRLKDCFLKVKHRKQGVSEKNLTSEFYVELFWATQKLCRWWRESMNLVELRRKNSKKSKYNLLIHPIHIIYWSIPSLPVPSHPVPVPSYQSYSYLSK
jgi:hypothetical protein